MARNVRIGMVIVALVILTFGASFAFRSPEPLRGIATYTSAGPPVVYDQVPLRIAVGMTSAMVAAVFVTVAVLYRRR